MPSLQRRAVKVEAARRR